jgi:tricarballylate dehydrogenase
LLDQGALAVGIPGDCHLVAVDARAPQDDAGIVSRVDGMPLGIVVDRDGERFHDEGEDSGPTRFSHWGQWLTRCPGQIAWLLLDADGTGELPPLLYAPLFAATLAELAARSGIDAQRLAATVAAYNAHVHDTGDDDGSLPPLRPPRTHTPKHPARALRRPPFAAIPMQPGISFTCYGVGVDTGARLRRTDGGRCRRVFAAGMIMAPAILGSAYLSGAALTISAVFGRIAGSNAAIAARAAGRPADAA